MTDDRDRPARSKTPNDVPSRREAGPSATDPSSGTEPDDRRTTRRSFLAATSLAAVAGMSSLARDGGESDGGSSGATTDDVFDPVRHGFGFRNWRPGEATASIPRLPSTDDIADLIRERWHEPMRRTLDRSVGSIPDGFVESISRQLRAGVSHLLDTDGYCYGMVFAAQRYFEKPDAIPVRSRYASEISHPATPRSDPDRTPVADEIAHLHGTQYLDFDAWFGRRLLFHPHWIDYETELAELRAAVDAFGTAGITLVSSDGVSSHQVLVYDYEEYASEVVLSVYDPNQPADYYETATRTIRIDTSGRTPTMQPYRYGRNYGHFIHNRYDRTIRTGATSDGPPSGVDASPATLREMVVGASLFVVASPTVRLAVLDPEGRPIENGRIARSADAVADETLYYRYGVDPGEYVVRVVGVADGEYELNVYAASLSTKVLEETITGSIAAGETRTYTVTVPGSSPLAATIERETSGSTRAAAAGAAGLGASYWYRNRSPDDGSA